MPTPCYQQVIYGPDVIENTETPDPLWTTRNVVIPLSSNHNLQTKFVYGDDEVQVLYQEHTLNVEAVIYKETFRGATDDMEAEVKRIRSILGTPGLQLKLYPVGLGAIDTIILTQPDAKGGPFPQDLSVQPIASNNAILIRWAVMFRTINCTSPATANLLQYNVEQDMNVDDDGNMEFTCHITYQTKNPITDPNSIQSLSNLLVKRVDKSFQGMTKKKRTSLSRDQRILSVRLVYKEIESDNAFFPYTSNIQITDEIESELLGTNIYNGKGFSTWRRSIGGSIRLPARIHKMYAWVVFIKILRARFKKLYPFAKISDVLDVTKDAAQNDDAEDEFYYLPLRIKITNPIYSRELRFDITYMITSDLQNLFNNTKIFARVNTQFTGAEEESEPLPLSTQWLTWQQSRNTNLNGLFQYTLDGTPIVYNQCTGTITGTHQVGPNALLPQEYDTDWDGVEPSEEIDPESEAYDAAYPEHKYDEEDVVASKSWVKYDNEFELIEDTNSIHVGFLEQPSSNYYSTPAGQGALADRVKVGMTLHGKNSNASQTYPNIVIERGHSNQMVRMYGHAIRAKYKIPIPYIVTIGGKVAKRIGTPRVSQKQVSTGDIPIYLAKWDITYAIVGGDVYSNDILSTIVSTGAPGHYT